VFNNVSVLPVLPVSRKHSLKLTAYISKLPSFPSELQLRVSFVLLNNQPPFLSVPHLCQTMKRRMVEWRSEKNVDGRGRGPLIFNDFPFIPSIWGWVSGSWTIELLLYAVVSVTPNPQPGGPGYPSSSGSYHLTCPAWVPLTVATLPPA
jgi:hypothetical protein